MDIDSSAAHVVALQRLNTEAWHTDFSCSSLSECTKHLPTIKLATEEFLAEPVTGVVFSPSFGPDERVLLTRASKDSGTFSASHPSFIFNHCTSCSSTQVKTCYVPVVVHLYNHPLCCEGLD